MDIYFQTDIGQRRRNNQDFTGSFYNQEQIPLVIVADGMGGHRAGDVASSMLVNGLGQKWQETAFSSAEEVSQWLIKNIQEANVAIFNKGQEIPEYNGMGSTVVAAVIQPRQFILAHVGDSRAYLWTGKKLDQLTVDHSLVQELVNQGEITPEMAQHHPQKNVVTRSVGMPGTVEVDVYDWKWSPDEVLLLCSDGLTNMVSDQRIAEVLEGAGDLQEKADTLIEEANQNGGVDNITVLLAANT